MRDVDQRKAVVQLAAQGRGARTIARALGASRDAVREVRCNGQAEVPELERPKKVDEDVADVRELHDCQKCVSGERILTNRQPRDGWNGQTDQECAT